MILALALFTQIAGGGILTILIYLIVLCLVAWLAYYIVNNLAPEPMRRILNVVLIVIFVIVICYFLLSLVGGGPNLRL